MQSTIRDRLVQETSTKISIEHSTCTIPMPTPSKQVGVPGTDDLQWDVTVALCIVDLLSQIQGSQLGKKSTQVSKDNGLAIE